MGREWWRGRQASRAWYDVGDATRSENTLGGAVAGGAVGGVVGGPIGAVVVPERARSSARQCRGGATITLTGIMGTITATIAIPKRYASKGCGAK